MTHNIVKQYSKTIEWKEIFPGYNQCHYNQKNVCWVNQLKKSSRIGNHKKIPGSCDRMWDIAFPVSCVNDGVVDIGKKQTA